MKIYDCFPFYNELDLLELRLTELYDHVDHFVLVEATTTFTDKPKPLYFEENKSRYAKWLDKIIHVKVEDMPHSTDPWVNDRFQRDQIFRGIKDAAPDDLILVSDLDELIRPEAIEHMRNSQESLFALRMPLFNFKFNYMRVSAGAYDIWGMAGRRSLFEYIMPDAFRFMRFQFMGSRGVDRGCEVIEHAGWHFGYLGDAEWLKDKAQSFAHTEVNNAAFIAQIDPETSIAQRTDWGHNGVDKYEIVRADDYFPKSISKYADRILTDATVSAFDILPPYPYNR